VRVPLREEAIDIAEQEIGGRIVQIVIRAEYPRARTVWKVFDLY
jgi:hypothetical protein